MAAQALFSLGSRSGSTIAADVMSVKSRSNLLVSSLLSRGDGCLVKGKEEAARAATAERNIALDDELDKCRACLVHSLLQVSSSDDDNAGDLVQY